MCGIVGMSFQKQIAARQHAAEKIKACFTQMLVKAQVRGSAATGIVIVNRGKTKPKATIIKAPLPAAKFVETEEYKKVINLLGESTMSIIGHTRASTSGSAYINKNNHPHVAGSIIGVHNGMFADHGKVWSKYAQEMTPSGECDSEAAFALINNNLKGGTKTQDAISLAMAEMRGWFALALVDVRAPHLTYLVKDSNTPLEAMWWRAGQATLFASDYTHISIPFKEKLYHHSVDRIEIEPNKITVLDSSEPSYTNSLMVNEYNLSLSSIEENKKIMEENADMLAITQGKEVN